LIVVVCCAVLIGVRPIYAQEQADIQYEIIAQLEIAGASGATWSPDGSRLAIIVWPNIQIWDTEQWELLRMIPDALVNSVEWNPTGDMVAGVRGGRDESVLIWNPTTGEQLREMTRPRPSDILGSLVIHTLSWHPDGTKIATDSGLSSNQLLIWDLSADDNPQSLVAGYPEASGSDYMNIVELDWSHSGQWLLVSGFDGDTPSWPIIRLYDATTGETISTFIYAFNPSWGANDEQFAGGSFINDRFVINIWDTESGEVLSTFEAPDRGVNTLSWNFHANVIAGARIYEPLILWDVDTGIRYDIEDVPTPFTVSVQWRPNSNQLAIADLNQGVTILEFEFDE
jgi:WD40 repeat protein